MVTRPAAGQLSREDKPKKKEKRALGTNNQGGSMVPSESCI